MQTRIVAIDGPGGAGKSTLAARLSAALGGVPIVHTDDFASWEEPSNWWPRLRVQVLEPLARNQAARYQRYDWDARQLADWHAVAPGNYVILEGVTASRAAFQPFLSFSVWVDTPREERLRRGLERDGAETLDLWLGWMAAEDAYITDEHPIERADMVISGTP
jgi:uridine kinase